jgi:Sterol carrier protein domain
VIEVRDELLPANAGRWRLATSGPASGADGFAASCERSGAEAELELDVTALGAAYLGGTGLGGLAGAGLVTSRRPGAVRELAAALAWEPAPWCPVDF